MNVENIITREEGFRTKPYLCSEGYVTIGLGTKLHNDKGLNPKDFPISVTLEQAEIWLEHDIARISISYGKSERMGKVFAEIDEDRRAILISMAYQMGTGGVYKFRKMWAALAVQDYKAAAKEALDSQWARQTASRALRHARVLRGETLEEVYGI